MSNIKNGQDRWKLKACGEDFYVYLTSINLFRGASWEEFCIYLTSIILFSGSSYLIKCYILYAGTHLEKKTASKHSEKDSFQGKRDP